MNRFDVIGDQLVRWSEDRVRPTPPRKFVAGPTCDRTARRTACWPATNTQPEEQPLTFLPDPPEDEPIVSVLSVDRIDNNVGPGVVITETDARGRIIWQRGLPLAAAEVLASALERAIDR